MKALLPAMEEYAASVQPELLQLIRDLCIIPAPSNHEEKRAEFCRDWFLRNGFTGVRVDEALNVLIPVGVDLDGTDEMNVMMAHTDVVFPDTDPLPFREEGGFMYCPGVGDDTARLAALMVAGAAFGSAEETTPVPRQSEDTWGWWTMKAM